jgi:hypothetical protein
MPFTNNLINDFYDFYDFNDLPPAMSLSKG